MPESPLHAIRRKCLDCSCDSINSVKTCPSLECPLWKFRLGLHPFTKKNQSNPFLQPSYFVGLENQEASEVIRIINER